jgi:hypothetical protein
MSSAIIQDSVWAEFEDIVNPDISFLLPSRPRHQNQTGTPHEPCTHMSSFMNLSSSPSVCAWLQRPFSAATAIDSSVGCPDLSTMALRLPALVESDIHWQHCRWHNQIMPTLVGAAGGKGLGNLWLSSLDPVLDAHWLVEREVFRISIATPGRQIILSHYHRMSTTSASHQTNPPLPPIMWAGL